MLENGRVTTNVEPTPQADQILDYARDLARRHGLSWKSSIDREIVISLALEDFAQTGRRQSA